MSVRFTPGLDDLAHPVRDAKLLAQFWPFFVVVGATRKFTRSELAFVGVVVRAVRTSACFHAGLEEVAIFPSVFFFFFFFCFSSPFFLCALERVDQLFELFDAGQNVTFFFRDPQFLA